MSGKVYFVLHRFPTRTPRVENSTGQVGYVERRPLIFVKEYLRDRLIVQKERAQDVLE